MVVRSDVRAASGTWDGPGRQGSDLLTNQLGPISDISALDNGRYAAGSGFENTAMIREAVAKVSRTCASPPHNCLFDQVH